MDEILNEEINSIKTKIDELEGKVENLAKGWYKPAVLNFAIGVTLLGLFFAYINDQQQKDAIANKEAHQNIQHIFSVRYDGLSNVMSLNNQLTKTRIDNTDENIKRIETELKRDIEKLERRR